MSDTTNNQNNQYYQLLIGEFQDRKKWNQLRKENPIFVPEPIDLSLNGAQLAGFDLNRAILDGAQLRGANLDGAILESAQFCRVEASGMSLISAQIHGANFQDAKLDNANLSNVNEPLFKITDQTLERLQGENIPRELLDSLNDMQDDQPKGQSDFLQLLERQFDQNNFNYYRMIILKYASYQNNENSFASVNFRNANLNGAILDGAILDGADLRGR